MILLLSLPVGCTHAAQSALPIAATRSLDPRTTPQFAALSFMIEKHARLSAAERKFYSAYVVPRSSLGDAIVAAFPHHLPLITNSIEVDTTTGEALNRATRARVKLWDTGSCSIDRDGATVVVNWYSGNVGAGMNLVELRRVNGIWQVTGEQQGWLSLTPLLVLTIAQARETPRSAVC
jgi:hypothetical protein